MLKNVEELKSERIKLQNNLQKEFDSALSYKEKLIILYRMLMTSQFYFQVYRGKNFFSEQFLSNLLLKFDSISEMNDVKFYEFVNNNLIEPLNSGHVTLRFNNEYTNELVKLYEKMQTISTKNKQIEDFLKSHKLSTLIQKLFLVKDLNDKSFLQFLEDNIFKIVPMDLIIPDYNKKNSENLSVLYLEDTVVISIKSFSRKYLFQDIIKLNELRSILISENYKNIVIDIRGNNGGTDEYFEYFNFLAFKPIIESNRWKNLFTGENEQCVFTAIPKGTDKQYAVYLLVDNKVFSTAQAFTSLCKSNNFATIVGEKTLGEGYGMTPFLLNLNTEYSLNLSFPIEAPINEKGIIDYENYYSTKPDIECKSENALDVTFELISQKKESLGK